MDKIEIILHKDSMGNSIALNEMNLQSSKSLREILDALIAIVEYEEGLKLKIGVRNGSAAQSIIAPKEDLEVVYKKIKDAADSNENRDNVYVGNLNVIRNHTINKNDYEIYYKSGTTKESLKPLFAEKFRSRRERIPIDNNFNAVFIKGYLELNGGKKPNFHLVSNNEPITIQCTEEEARKVNSFLYRTILISAFAKAKKKGMEYTFCDIYAGDAEKYYIEFKNFFKDLKGKAGTEPFHMIREKLEEFYDTKDFTGAKKFIRIFVNEFSTPTYLRTILVISKGFRKHQDLSDILNDVELLLTTKFGQIN